VKVGNKIVCANVTNDLEQRGAEYKAGELDCELLKASLRTTSERALERERWWGQPAVSVTDVT